MLNSLIATTTRMASAPYTLTKSALRSTLGSVAAPDINIDADISDDPHPVVLVHGYMDNGHTPWWEVLTDYLTQAGYPETHIYSVSVGALPGTTVGDPITAAETIEAIINEAVAEHSAPVDIIAHSMGGLAARWSIEQNAYNEYVDDFITLGTPHQSTTTAYLGWFTEGARAMMPGSDFLETLNASPPAPNVTYTCIWSPTDALILPQSNATLPHDSVTNLKSHPTTHMELVHDPDIFKKYVSLLD